VKSQNGRPRFVLGARALETQDALGSVLAQLPKDPGVLIKADPEAPVEFTAAAMQAASDAGFTKVTFVTRTR
jgi:biopolymer transport protein ExbD